MMRILLPHTFVLAGFAAILFRYHRFGAANLWLTMLPVVGVLLASVSRAFSGRVLAGASLPIFLIALALPAIRLASDLAYGIAAFALSFLGVSLFGNWGFSGERFWYPIACLAGAIANVLFFYGYVAISRRKVSHARWSASLALLLSLLVTISLVFSTELNGLYMGHGLWWTSLLMLSLGSWNVVPSDLADRESVIHAIGSNAIRRRKTLLACVFLLMVVIPIGVTIVQQMRASAQRDADELVVQENDVLVAQEVHQQVTDYFSELDESDPVFQRYGKFVRLRGKGHRHFKSLHGIPIFNLPRRAVFENGEVDCLIGVYIGPSEVTEVTMYPDPQWMAERPDHRLEKQGSEWVHIGPDMRGMTSMEVHVTHPNLFHSVRQRDRTASQHVEMDSLLEQLANNDHAEAIRWLAEQQRSQPVTAFVQRALQSNQLGVQVNAIKVLRTRKYKDGITLPDDAVKMLLDVVADSNAETQVRQEAVATLLLVDRREREKLYDVLRKLGPNGRFAIAPVVELVSDRSKKHWQTGAAFAAPTGAVELLGFWGADAAEAVSVLESIVQGEHPNQWNYAPAAAEALGNIGSPAESAIPTLVLATSSSYSDLATKAKEALEKLRPHAAKDYSIRRILKFSEELESNQFYPVAAQTRFYSWLEEDASHIILLRVEGEAGLLVRVDVATGMGKLLFELDVSGIRSAHLDTRGLHILKVNVTESQKFVVVDSWSLTEQRRTSSNEVYRSKLAQPTKKVVIENIVWCSSKPRLAFTVSRRLKVISLNEETIVIPDRVQEYLMRPIGFSDSGGELYLHDWNFANKTYGIARMDIATATTEVLRPDCRSDIGLVGNGEDSDWIAFYPGTSSPRKQVNLLAVASSDVFPVSLQEDIAHYRHPWVIAQAMDPTRRQVGVVTEKSLDVHAVDSGERVASVSVFHPDGRQKISPLMFSYRDGKYVCLAQSNKDELWVHSLEVRN